MDRANGRLMSAMDGKRTLLDGRAHEIGVHVTSINLPPVPMDELIAAPADRSNRLSGVKPRGALSQFSAAY